MVSMLNAVLENHQEKEHTLSDKTCLLLTEAIISGDLAQGEKLSEADLATRYGISRGPLREAIRKLEGMRLVTRIPHAGARVVQLNLDTMADLYQVREALEGMACRVAAETMSDQEIEGLFDLLDQHEKQINAADGQQYSQNESNFDFHYLIAQGSQNQLLIDLLSGELYHLLRLCRYRTSRLAERTHLALKQHRQIVEAIEARDPELAELLMRRHISGAWNTIRQLMDETVDKH